MVTDKPTPSSNNPLEQYVLLAKSTKGAACLALIKLVLEAPGVHVFGELLDMPNVAEVRSFFIHFSVLASDSIFFSLKSVQIAITIIR